MTTATRAEKICARAPGWRGRAISFALTLALLIGWGSGAWAAPSPQAAEPTPSPAAATEVNARRPVAAAPATNGALASDDTYASREAHAQGLENFKGGDTVVIFGGSALLIVVVVVLVLIIL